MDLLKTLYILPLVLLTSCFEDFTPDIESKSVICVNSTITAGAPIEVAVTRTRFFTDSEQDGKPAVSDATVSILVNGEPMAAGYLAREKDQVIIKAESKTYGSAEAEVNVPEKISITGADWTGRITGESGSEDEIRSYYMDVDLKLTIKDQPGIDNFYQLVIEPFAMQEEQPEGSGEIYFNPGQVDYDAEPLFSEHIGIIDIVFNEATSEGFNFFTDKQFDGKEYTLLLRFKGMTLYTWQIDDRKEIPDFGLKIYLNNVSRSLYFWNCYLWQTQFGYIFDLAEYGLSEPLWGYSNVSTGAGVVGAQAYTLRSVSLKEMLTAED